jgi:hypothetical protein
MGILITLITVIKLNYNYKINLIIAIEILTFKNGRYSSSCPMMCVHKNAVQT